MSEYLSPEQLITHYQDSGYTDEEIVDELSRWGRAVHVHPGGELEWVHGDPSSLQQRRVLKEWLARGRGHERTDVTAEAVRAERARRIAANEASGYDALAKHFKCDESTIRRRLGVLVDKRTP